MSRLAPHLRPATEREIENAIRDLFLRAGWYVAKTDSGMVARGRTATPRGHLRQGFPDLTMLRRLPGTPLCLAALIEVKTATSKLRDSQVTCHAELRDLYGLHPQVVRSSEEAAHLIAEGLRLAACLKDAAATANPGDELARDCGRLGLL